MRFTTSLSIGLGAILIAWAGACGGGQPAPPPVPVVDSAAIRDSIARAEAARRAREDSIARARAEAERIAAARRDSIARVEAETRRVREMLQARIHFAYDRSEIRPGDATVLDQKVAILQANPNVRIRITGHCDERGSDEYNLALGNRRAVAARQYLVSRGIAADRIETASMGEEQPVAMGATEDAWAQNRRDEFVITGGGNMLRAPSGM